MLKLLLVLTVLDIFHVATGEDNSFTASASLDSTNLTKDVQELKKAVADLLNVLSPTKQSFKFVPRSCREIYMEFPFSSSGKYIIDPDGPKGDPSISVYCNMESGGTTVISHNAEDETVPSHEALRHITYNATLRQIEALIKTSKTCQQSIKINCRSFALTFNGNHQASWLSRGAEKQHFWAGSNSSVHTCQCGIDKNCISPAVKCNCDSMKPRNLTDEGYITDMKTLPVTALLFSSIEEYSYVSYTVGKLKCNGRAEVSKVPESCSDLWAIGHNLNGIYLVKKSGALQSVFCDFSKLPGEEGIEKQIATVDAKTSSVYFNVKRNASFNSAGSVIPFDVESLNVGKAMNIQNGIFTAPKSGIYYFSFNGITWGRESSSLFRILLNDRKIGISHSGKHGFSPFSWSSTIHMKQGDELKLVLEDGNVFDNDDMHSHFSGMLLKEDVIP